MVKKFGSTEKCIVCTKTVYPLEKLTADEKIYHKSCFKCTECNSILSLGKYASKDNGTLFCKVCFKKLFFSKGNYSEGFGQLKPQHEFEKKKNGGENKEEITPSEVEVAASS
ncbi:hypothetical protein ACTA71_003908 [Dictyostelium dimigraforme]